MKLGLYTALTMVATTARTGAVVQQKANNFREREVFDPSKLKVV